MIFHPDCKDSKIFIVHTDDHKMFDLGCFEVEDDYEIVVNASIQNIILGMKAISQIGTNSLMIGMKITMKKMISLSTFGQQKELICTLMQMI